MTTYLDHAATTPMTPAAREAMVEQLALTGNASSLHGPGRDARRVVEESRERIAAALGARPSEIVFTSGGTEADNLAITGSLRAARAADPLRSRVVVSGVEHHAVLDVVDHAVEHEGAQATFVAPGECGAVQPDAVRAAIEEDPASVGLVSVMWANNESGVDLMSISAHKFGGPLGIGALVAKRDARLVALSHGGGQERGVRSGTLDVPAIRGFAVALTEAVERREAEAARVGVLRDRFLAGTQALDLDIRITGCWTSGDVSNRLPGNAHITIPGCEGDSMLYLLDAAGVAVSTGSACQAGIPQPSHVVLAMGRSEEEARGSLRVSFGWTSTEADVDAVLAALPEAVERARRASGAA